jgi:Cu/Ag efflux pump CusA
VVKGYPNLTAVVSTYPNLLISDLIAGAEHDLVVRVYGRDYQVLLEKADMVAKSIKDVAGVVSPTVVPPVVEPTVEVEVNVEQAAARGVKPGDARRAAGTIVSGVIAGNMFEDQKIFDVVVWGTPTKRESLKSIADVYVDNSGELVRLSDIADVRIRPNPSVIKHDAVSRYVDVVAQVQGRDLGAVRSELEGRLKQINFPTEYHLEVLGEAEERAAAQRTVLAYAIGALIALYFLLQAAFGSWRLATMYYLLLSVPLAGAALAASLQPGISILSLVGGLAVLAVAVRGGILLIARYQRLEREGEPLGRDLVLLGSQQRFKAIVLSTAVAAVALVPLAVAGAVTEIGRASCRERV